MTQTETHTTFRAVSFGRTQMLDSPMTASAGYYEQRAGGDVMYEVEGRLEGREAQEAVTLHGLQGGALHAIIPVQICALDFNTYERTCSSGTRRVDATAQPIEGGAPDRYRTFEPRWPGCADYCISETRFATTREATGSLTVDGAAATGTRDRELRDLRRAHAHPDPAPAGPAG